jgi:hypothetical protein
MISIQSIEKGNNDLQFLLIIAILGLLALLIQTFPKLIRVYWKATVTNNHNAVQFAQNENQSSKTIGLGIDVLTLLVISFFSVSTLLKLELLPNITNSFWSLFALAMLFFFLLSAAKKGLIWILGWLFLEPTMAEIHKAHLTLNFRILMIGLIPCLIFIIYAKGEISLIACYIGLICCTLQYIVRVLRLMITSFKVVSLPKYFSIVYLCTLEILPLVMTVKFLAIN